MKKGWKALWLLLKANRWHYIIALVSTLILNLINFLQPMIYSETYDVVLANEPSSLPEWVKNILRAIFGGREYFRQHLWIVAVVLAFSSLLFAFFTYLQSRNLYNAGENIAQSLRDRLFGHISFLSYDYYVHAETGDLIQRCTSDVETVQHFLSGVLLQAADAIMMIAVSMTILLQRDAEIALLSLVTLPIMWVASYFYFKKMTKDYEACDESEAHMSTVLQENLTGVRVVRAFGMQRNEVEHFDKANRDYEKKGKKVGLNMSVYWSLMDLIPWLQILGTSVLCIYKAVDGSITVGTMTMFITYINMLIFPIRNLGRILSEAGKSIVAMGRIDEILKLPAEKHLDSETCPPLTGDIVFEHVSFRYPEGNEVLHDLCMTIPSGKTCAILGNTGSGKSTLVHLLQRLKEPTEGRITIGGVDIRNIDKFYLRRHVGLMLQESFLYGRSIMGNLRIAAPDTTDEQVMEVAELSRVDSFVSTFEKGYDTILGERGVNLSGGQRQRIAIARTLLKPNSIIVFDDSLSAVDMQTDRAIRANLHHLQGKLTTIIISHRISTLCEADRIFVLENGRLSDEGTHQELISREGLYKQICRIQDAMKDDIKSGTDLSGKECNA